MCTLYSYKILIAPVINDSGTKISFLQDRHPYFSAKTALAVNSWNRVLVDAIPERFYKWLALEKSREVVQETVIDGEKKENTECPHQKVLIKQLIKGCSDCVQVKV